MELRFENTKAGTKVYDGKKHVKTIPKRYESDFDKIEPDFTRKRLTGSERFQLEHMYFIRILKISEKYVWELVKDAKPVKAYPVNVHDGSTRYEMLYDNGVKLKIDKEFYMVFEEKDDLHYSNY